MQRMPCTPLGGKVLITAHNAKPWVIIIIIKVLNKAIASTKPWVWCHVDQVCEFQKRLYPVLSTTDRELGMLLPGGVVL
jgi:hypothetical protein